MDWKDWVDRVYEAVDRKSAEDYVAFLTDDASFRFGNADPVKGREAVREAVAGFFGSITGLRHTFTGKWKVEEAIILQGEVEYTRLDGGAVNLPFATINGMEGGLARRIEIYIDPGPLFAP